MELNSKKEMIYGICLDIANYLKVDPILVRILTIVLGICTGILPAIILYFCIGMIKTLND